MNSTNHTINLDETITVSPLTISDTQFLSGTTIDLSGVSLTTSGQGYSPSYSIGGSNVSNTVWTSSNTGWNHSAIGATITPSATISLKGEDADIDLNGKSMKAWMEKIEERLNILTPNPELEKEWDELRKLGERYRKLEKKCKEKAEVWNKLKSMPPPTLD